MKKILLSLFMVALACGASAQIVVSANIGGNMVSGEKYTATRIVLLGGDSSYTSTAPLVSQSSLTAGFKVGYKFGAKAQAGIAASYSMYSIKDQPLDPTLLPMMSESGLAGWKTTGSMSTKGNSFSVSPYFRYDVLKAGDISLFAELELFYTKVNDPKISAEVHNKLTLIAAEYSFDTTETDRVVPKGSTTLGVRVLPGMSWQLNKNCSIDLYFDFLSLAYTKTTSVNTAVNYDFHVSASGAVTFDATTITTTDESTNIGGGVTGIPALTEVGANNWVRVGFNLTF